MTGWDILKFDVRVRQRMMAKALLTPAQLQRHLDELPDMDGRCDIVAPQQPAVGTRGSRDAVVRMGVAPIAPVSTEIGSEAASAPAAEAPQAEKGAEVDRGWADEDLS